MVAGRAIVSFDLRAAADVHYRGILRYPRWLALAIIVFLSAVVIFRTIVDGFELLLLPVIACIFALGWIVLFLAAPGPIRLTESGPTVEFIYRDGRVLRVEFADQRLELRLFERAHKEGRIRTRGVRSDADFLATVGIRQFGLTREAYEFLNAKAVRSGFVATEDRYAGGKSPSIWRCVTYSRTAPRQLTERA